MSAPWSPRTAVLLPRPRAAFETAVKIHIGHQKFLLLYHHLVPMASSLITPRRFSAFGKRSSGASPVTSPSSSEESVARSSSSSTSALVPDRCDCHMWMGNYLCKFKYEGEQYGFWCYRLLDVVTSDPSSKEQSPPPPVGVLLKWPCSSTTD